MLVSIVRGILILRLLRLSYALLVPRTSGEDYGSRLAAPQADNQMIEVPSTRPWQGLYDLPRFLKSYREHQGSSWLSTPIPKEACWTVPRGGGPGSKFAILQPANSVHDKHTKTSVPPILYLQKS